jgi:hypothetical protein
MYVLHDLFKEQIHKPLTSQMVLLSQNLGPENLGGLPKDTLGKPGFKSRHLWVQSQYLSPVQLSH